MKTILSRFCTGDMVLLYLLEEETRTVGFAMFPLALEDRFTLAGGWKVESLIQLKRIGDAYPIGFSNGHTLRNSGTCQRLRYEGQKAGEEDGTFTISTVLSSPELRGVHRVSWRKGDRSVTVRTELENIGTAAERLEMLSSFSLCSLFGFSEEERTGDFLLHRLRSRWSEEGRLETRSFLELQMEPSWQRYGAQSIRYGQVGSMPVRRFFPWFAVEDRRFGCMLGGNLAVASSWQMELFSEDDRPAVSGGLADREFGCWMKTLQPGERFVTPAAELTCCVGSLDEVSDRIISRQRENLCRAPELERELPVVFNEFCTSWGRPTEREVEALAARLEGKGVTYCVIDAGWHADAIRGWAFNMGDWEVSKEAFPSGLKAAAEAIRAHGMVPGIWFEPETCGADSGMFRNETMLLRRDGCVITTDRRRFLDMRRADVRQFLETRVIQCLKDNGFGYLKVDYNDNIGLGCDGPDSLGENLRQHMECSRAFYQKIHREMPELVMENCASGGHRLEPSMMELFSMASFSDAHECLSGPIIAANVHRAIQPAQSQIWAVLRADAEPKRLRYVLAGTFLGRMCLSGDIDRLSDEQWSVVENSISFYRRCAPVIRDGVTHRHGPEVASYAHPHGYQIVVRRTPTQAMAVIHTFARQGGDDRIQERLPELADYRIAGSLGDEEADVCLGGDGTLCIRNLKEFDGLVLLLSAAQSEEAPA